MPARQHRTHLGPGRYREGDALIAEVRIGSRHNGTEQRRRQKFPLGTDDAVMIAWQHHAKGNLIETRPLTASRGTLAADVPDYLRDIPNGRYKYDTTQILNRWIESPVGAMPRNTITHRDIQAQITTWTNAGVGNSTCNRRLSRLRKLFRALDGIDAPNPAEKISFLPNPEKEARDIPPRIVKLILDSLPDLGRTPKATPDNPNPTRPKVSVTKIRLRVMAWTGIGAATLRRVQPRHLELNAARIYLTARRKAKGVVGGWMALTPPAVEALREFAAQNLFGRTYSNSSTGKTWRVGIARARRRAAELAASDGDATWLTDIENLPPRCKPYDVRHAFACEVYRKTGDIGAVKELLQHASPATTMRYTKGAVSTVVAAAIAKVSAESYGTIPTIPAPAPKVARRLRIVRVS